MSENMADKMKRKLNAKSFTAIILFGAIILVFVFFGLPGRMGVSAGYVARVNNTLISFADFQQEENRIKQYYQNIFGNQMDFSSQRQLLQQQALENLVRMELVSQAAQANGILATDAEVRHYIVSEIPVFQQGGFFQREIYGRYLESIRSSPANFESKVRKDISNVRTRSFFEIVAAPTAAELKAFEQLRGYKVNIQFARIDQEASKKGSTPEKVDEHLKGLEDALAKGDESAVNSHLKALNATWDETGLVDMGAETFPKINSTVATEAIFDLQKSEPLLKHLVRDGGAKFVLKLKEAKVETPKAVEASMLEMSQKRRGDGLFEAWINSYRAESDVSTNPKALQMLK